MMKNFDSANEIQTIRLESNNEINVNNNLNHVTNDQKLNSEMSQKPPNNQNKQPHLCVSLPGPPRFPRCPPS